MGPELCSREYKRYKGQENEEEGKRSYCKTLRKTEDTGI